MNIGSMDKNTYFEVQRSSDFQYIAVPRLSVLRQRHTALKFISKELIINRLSTWNHPDNWLPWIIISNKDHRQG